MKVYFAGRYDRRLELLDLAKTLPEGVECNSRWLQGTHITAAGLDESTNQNAPLMTVQTLVKEDFEDLLYCRALVFFSQPEGDEGKRGGRHVEMGVALGRNIPVIVYGRKENVFHSLPQVWIATEWEDVIKLLVSLGKWYE